MSIRVRLALWYGMLTGSVLALMALFSYAFHNRGHYDDLDRILLSSSEHAAAGIELAEGLPHFAQRLSNLDMMLRLYDANEAVLEAYPEISELAPVSPQAILSSPDTPAFDWIAGLTPSMISSHTVPGEGVFTVVSTTEQRWRVYIMPLRANGEVVGYLEASAPLGRLDASMRAFRQALVLLGVSTLAAGFVGSGATASAALRPVSHMIAAARSIAGSRDLSRRVEGPAQRDELSELAHAFNTMLASLEAASAAQQRFVSDASHELRAPLTAIQGNLELLEKHPDMSAEDRHEAIKEASREAHRLTRLVADLLALARADAGVSIPYQRVELDQIILEAVHQARHLATHQQLETGTLEPFIVSGNPDRLTQLMLILLDNAIKYSQEGGRVVVSLRRSPAGAVVTVTDTGVGIAPDALPHIFERFYRADPARSRDPGGTGLGLPIARWIVEQHHGQISVDSTPNQGTVVTITFPSR